MEPPQPVSGSDHIKSQFPLQSGIVHSGNLSEARYGLATRTVRMLHTPPLTQIPPLLPSHPPHMMMGMPFNVCNLNCSVPLMPNVPMQSMMPSDFTQYMPNLSGHTQTSSSGPSMTPVFVPPSHRPTTGAASSASPKPPSDSSLLSSGQNASPDNIVGDPTAPLPSASVSAALLTCGKRSFQSHFSGLSAIASSNGSQVQHQGVQTGARSQTLTQNTTTPAVNSATGTIHYPMLGYYDSLTVAIWQFFLETRQSPVKYAKKVHLRNAMHMMVSSVFENSKLFIVGSSINGFGSDHSDMDLCLTVSSEEFQAKRETSVVLSQLIGPLRKCCFILNCNLIRAKVPILKFRDALTEVDCDLNVNNVVGIYNTHLLAMYTRIDWRVRPLGMFIKNWAQKMDIHDGSRGRLSTYPLLLMLIQYLQCGCSPPILPNLQARFPKAFNYERPVNELDMHLQLPWSELCSLNTSTLSELFAGFIHYYASFDFTRWAVSVKHGAPLPIDVAIRCLPPHEQAHTTCSFKIFVEEPFCLANAARSLYDDNVLSLIQQVFHRTDRALRLQKPLDSLWSGSNAEQ